MRSVYQHAALTIVAANASSADEGFLAKGQPPSYFVEPFEVPFCTESGTQERVSIGYLADYKRWKDPVNSRCWTLQELLLSPHLLVYSYNNLQMISRNDASEVSTGNNESGLLPAGLTWNSPLFTSEGDPRTARDMWLAIRDEYTKRKLAHGKDKLIAIAAVAEEMSPILGAYLAGLWERDLFLDLQWRRPDIESDDFEQSKRNARPSSYRAPSWSWASIDGEVACFEEEDVRGPYLFVVKQCTTDLLDSSLPYAAVRGARLEVEGRTCEFFWRASRDSVSDHCDGFLVTLVGYDEQNPERVVGEATEDALEPDLVPGLPVTCLAISTVQRIPNRIETEGMMLLPAGSDCYRRIGFFKVYNPLAFDDCKPRTILII